MEEDRGQSSGYTGQRNLLQPSLSSLASPAKTECVEEKISTAKSPAANVLLEMAREVTRLTSGSDLNLRWVCSGSCLKLRGIFTPASSTDQSKPRSPDLSEDETPNQTANMTPQRPCTTCLSAFQLQGPPVILGHCPAPTGEMRDAGPRVALLERV
ncbi:hypothetical protein Q8A67_019730 [Cirrhinus molitorella]|uniref:Uncharacterized protein n=1 Tax=Cirrhinus molitorella TaxID=172907 RepID=A0AA88P7N9_9TELE|nr:hypothetical protein Q8A67_019730 [Cirrhinus molitorella]